MTGYQSKKAAAEAKLEGGSMTQCKCDLRIRLLGDGCRYCNPQEYIDQLIESLEEQRKPLTDEEIFELLTQTDELAVRLPRGLRDFARAIEAAHGIKGEA